MSTQLSLRIMDTPESSTVQLADTATAMKAAGHTVIDFSAGRAAEATDGEICAMATQAMKEGDTHQTMARGTLSYREAVAEKLARENGLLLDPEKNIISTMGCKQGLTLSLLTLINPGDEVIVEDPCFVSYGPTIKLLGGVPVVVKNSPENQYRWTREDLEAAITPKTKVILFCSPNNPTGIVHSKKDLQLIADIAIQHDLYVVADEIYEAVTWGGRKHIPVFSLPGMSERTVGLMGMTKSYSMGGWRIGYLYASNAIIERMVVAQQHLITSTSSIAMRAASTALGAPVTERLRDTIWQDWQKRCGSMVLGLNAIDGLRTRMPEGGFYAWVDISQTGLSSMAFCQQLLEQQKVVVVPGITFGESCDNFIRVTCVKSWKDNEEGLTRIRTFVESL